MDELSASLIYEGADQKEEMLDEIMDTYGQMIQQLAYTYVKDKSIAEDLTQDIFIKVYKKLEQYDGRASIKTWIYQIAINHCKDYLKSWYHRKVMLTEKMSEMIASKRDNIEQQIIEKNEEKQLVNAVLQLPVKYREVVFLYYFEELSIHEMSETLTTNANTLKTRLKRARQLLKQKLEEEE